MLLQSDEAKQRLIQSLQQGFNYNGWRFEDWVVLHCHCHLMADSPDNAENLTGIIRDIHQFTGIREISRIFDSKTKHRGLLTL